MDLLVKESILTGCPNNYKFSLNDRIAHLEKDEQTHEKIYGQGFVQPTRLNAQHFKTAVA